jgi:hypothetical protein
MIADRRNDFPLDIGEGFLVFELVFEEILNSYIVTG